MRFFVLIGILIFGFISPVLAQQIACTVKDAETEQPIQGVHIYDNSNPQNGTVTNSEGTFVWNVSSDVILVFSHLGYQLTTFTSTELSNTESISLKPLIIPLKEVIVKGMGPHEIMEEVIDRLEKNHQVEPVHYRFHSRIIEIACDSSDVYSLEEMAGYLEQNESHFTSFHLIKSRFTYFEKQAKILEGGRRFISGTQLYTDNILRFKKGYLHKKELKKNYRLQYQGDTTIGDFYCYVLFFEELNDKQEASSGWIYVDQESYGIVRLHVNQDKLGVFQRDTYFQQIEGKWYLSYTRYKWNHCEKLKYIPLTMVRERQTIYQKIDLVDNEMEFTPKAFLSTKFVKDYIDDYNDPYWDENPFIPVPEWLQSMIDASEHIKP